MRQFSIGPPRVPDWGLCDFDMNGNLARHLGVGSTGSSQKVWSNPPKRRSTQTAKPQIPTGRNTRNRSASRRPRPRGRPRPTEATRRSCRVHASSQFFLPSVIGENFPRALPRQRQSGHSSHCTRFDADSRCETGLRRRPKSIRRSGRERRHQTPLTPNARGFARKALPIIRFVRF